MIKKVSLAVASLLVLITMSAAAQQVGSWSIYPVFSGSSNTSLIDTDSKTYYLADGWLYAFDKEAEESVFYTKMNGMSDTEISGIYYNYDKKFLLVAYSNSNIDIVRDNGRVDNIPDLKNVILTVSKAINGVDFQGDYAYVATDFGYMVVDCEKCVVKESFNYGKQFKSIIATDKYIFATFDKKLNVSEINASHYELASFSETSIKQEMMLRKLDNNTFLTTTGWFYYVKVGDDPKNLSLVLIEQSAPSNVSMSGKNAIASYAGKYVVVSADGSTQSVAMPESIDCSMLSSYNGKNLWSLDVKGLKEFTISDGSVIFLHDSFRPNTTTVSEPYYLTYLNGELYTMNSGQNYKDALHQPIALARMDEGKWQNLAPTELTFSNSNSRGKLSGVYGMAIDPNDKDKIWVGSWFEGIYCFKDGKQIQKIDNTNSPLYQDYVCCVTDLKFDKDGNLWIAFFNYNNLNYSSLFMLPAAKLFKSDLTAADFVDYNFGKVETSREGILHITRDERYILYASNYWKTKLMVVDTNGTISDSSDDKIAVISTFSDQEGKLLDIGRINSFCEDNSGKIWITTNTGVGVINNVASAFGNNFYINRVKVPRNDGTNLADYLLDGLGVYCMKQDGAGRKWIGTASSGLYLVSEDGSEILEHFTTDNSPLTDNLITGIECSTDDNRVFIGTKKGTLVYESDATPSKSDYSNVYAYPNPVRPDYGGYITVAGLMDNSLVKIADSMGNVIYSGRSTGGMFVWNGCNSDGSRVNTGVYYVFASQNEDGKSSGCVTKILVVK